MKKLLKIIAGVFAFLLLSAVLIPILFKDQIRERIDKEIGKRVNAQVYFSPSKFGLSLFRNFPHITVSMGDFGIVGKDSFAGDTLMDVGNFRVVVDIKSIFSGDQMRINAIQLDDPKILVKILEDGKANYDIMIDDGTEEVVEDEESSEFNVGIENWEINNGLLVYDDRETKAYTRIEGLFHSGKGDFNQDIFDMHTKTRVKALSAKYDGVEYLTNKTLDIDMVLNMNMPEAKYTFKENVIKLNDFAFAFDGYFAMPGDDYEMDITYGSKDNAFKSILSLVPGIYKEGFENLETEGSLTFGGMVKGIYSEAKEMMPAFDFSLVIKDGMFHYPELPSAVKNVNMDLLVENKDGVLDHTIIDLKNFHMNMGSNPVDAKVLINGLGKSQIDAEVLAKLNLEELSTMIPMDGMQLKGLYSLDLKANGTYDTLTSQFPVVNVAMNLKNGFVRMEEMPVPLEHINFSALIQNKNGSMAETLVNVNDFNMLMDGERFNASLILQNLEDYQWDLKLKGVIDLDKMTKLYPVEGMTLAGKIDADVQTKGKMSDVDQERYENLPTSGTINIQDLKYYSDDLPQGFFITQAQTIFNPDKIIIAKFDGAAGRSKFQIDGALSNYIGYMFKEGQVLKGNMNFLSDKFDLNEWMSEEEVEESSEEEVPLEVFEVPKNIDFVLRSNLKEVIYDNLVLADMRGDIIVKDGIVRMSKLGFNTLGGQFVMNGTYDTRDMEKPAFDFDMNIQNLLVKAAYENFNTVKALVPIGEKVNGSFSTDFKIKGLLGPDMSPITNTLTGGGLIKIAQASVTESKLIAGVTSLTKLRDADGITLKDVLLKAAIKDGRLSVEPFDVVFGGYKTTISGSNGIDGSLDYKLRMDVPTGAAGAAVSSAIASLTGVNAATSNNIFLNFNVGGNYENPKVTLASAEAGPASGAKSAVKEKVNAEVDKAREEAEAKAKAEADRIKAEAEAKKREAERKAREEEERRKREAEEKARQEAEKTKDQGKDKAKDLIKRRF
jgi:hypothetical protein